MQEHYTDRARKAIQLATQEAHRLDHDHVGTGHLLLGLVKEGTGMAVRVLNDHGLDLGELRREMEKKQEYAWSGVTVGKLPQSPKFKLALVNAIEEAEKLNEKQLRTEHLFLGLLREPEGVAAQLLLDRGLNLDDLRQEVLRWSGNPLRELARMLRAELDKQQQLLALLNQSPLFLAGQSLFFLAGFGGTLVAYWVGHSLGWDHGNSLWLAFGSGMALVLVSIVASLVRAKPAQG